MDTTLAPTVGRVVAVRLTEIPIRRRRQSGQTLYENAVAERDLAQALAIEMAIEEPSDRVYWVSEIAYRRVLGGIA